MGRRMLWLLLFFLFYGEGKGGRGSGFYLSLSFLSFFLRGTREGVGWV